MYDVGKPADEAVTILTTRDIRVHAELRKVWNRAFTPTALKGYDDIMRKRTLQLLERLEQQAGTLDLGKWISYYT